MTDERWKQLMNSQHLKITADEIKAGWHWCVEFDGLLVDFNDKENEGKFCHCYNEDGTPKDQYA